MSRWQGWMALFLLWHLALRDATESGASLVIVVLGWAAAALCLACTLLEIHRYWSKDEDDD